ncbi:polysaccharide deacetylase family protein [Flammeovirga pectinis]|uniref:Polysaccharide deacetylase family protein n=1 Tax=Flammeovirga pectinis TaxID=2494373 RepID=A0A3S9P4L8_9BACT|nr:polysaccharide deacetylase family protein [Flammeovirga pectinis]AZQ63032.1 polysaccharide deacetylase family protein [Flammeovirga pectinis]
MIQRVGSFVRNKMFPSLTWKKEKGEHPSIYLTFDDGPIPEITPWVLDLLKEYNAKATFFCVGDNIKKYPDTYNKVLEEGHTVGNHTFNHLQYWKNGLSKYLKNIDECEKWLNSNNKFIEKKPRKLFRPPHGQIGKKLLQKVLPDYEIIMWHVLTRDYNKNYNEETCLKTAIKLTEDGSIVVFHDSLKAEKNLKYVLPRFLAFFSKKGYKFKSL